MDKHNIVVLGAGYGGIKALQQLHGYLKGSKGYQLLLVNKHNYHMFMTQLHQHAAGTSDTDQVMVPLDTILEGKDVKFVKGWVDGIDLINRQVLVDHGDIKLPFKYLVVALGSEPEYYNIEGLKEYSMSIRSLYSARHVRKSIQQILRQTDKKPLTFVVGGGGLTGIEFAGELAFQLKRSASQYNLFPGDYQIIVVEGAKELLPGMDGNMAHYAKETLEEMGVQVITGALIKRVTEHKIHLTSGKDLSYSLLLWAGGIKGNKVLAQSGLKTDARGRVEVNQYLQSLVDPEVYVVGDSALAKDPKDNKVVTPTAQAAIQQGAVAAYNIYADITGKEKRVYQPVVLGTLVSIGRGKAFGNVKTFKFKGITASWLKEAIPVKYRYSLGGLKMFTQTHKQREDIQLQGEL
ncbi:NAD(P)/FAD-dependent oxidoreductase [Peptococcaceae bacterium 1198_IL3148]